MFLFSCLQPRKYTVLRDLSYRPDATEREQGDLYLPEGSGPHPVAIVIHGGGWSGRDRSDMEDIAKRLANKGIAAFNINYRLAPQHRFPAQLEDVQAALQWVATTSSTHSLDLNRIYTVGYSAGAHLALLAAASSTPDVPHVTGVIAGGAPTDLTLYPESPYVEDLMGVPFQENPQPFREASPLHQVTPTHPPVFLYHGKLDNIVAYRNSVLLRDALQKAGVTVKLQSRSLEGHILTYFREGPSLREGIRFLQNLDYSTKGSTP